MANLGAERGAIRILLNSALDSASHSVDKIRVRRVADRLLDVLGQSGVGDIDPLNGITILGPYLTPGERDGINNALGGEPDYTFPGFAFYVIRRRVQIRDSDILLTPKQAGILSIFCQKPNQWLSSLGFIDEFGRDVKTTKTGIRWHVKQLREKLEEDPKDPRLIKSRIRLGYMFCPPNLE